MEYINSLYIDASVSKTSHVQKKKEYFKRPLMAEDVIPVEMAHMYSAQSIHMLSQYCTHAGINFVWGTWHDGTNDIINLMKYNNYFKNHIDMNIYKFDYDYDLKIDTVKDPDGNTLDCHLENKDDPEFHLALDVQNGVHNAHFGSHRHLHYYETFLNHIRNPE